MKPALQIVHSLARLQCTKCGAEANASCNCGEPYVPAALRVAEYDKANPGKSTREAAADLGISNKTVSKARGVTGVTPETVTGRDGKTYKAKREVEPEARRSAATVEQIDLETAVAIVVDHLKTLPHDSDEQRAFVRRIAEGITDEGESGWLTNHLDSVESNKRQAEAERAARSEAAKRREKAKAERREQAANITKPLR